MQAYLVLFDPARRATLDAALGVQVFTVESTHINLESKEQVAAAEVEAAALSAARSKRVGNFMPPTIHHGGSFSSNGSVSRSSSFSTLPPGDASLHTLAHSSSNSSLKGISAPPSVVLSPSSIASSSGIPVLFAPSAAQSSSSSSSSSGSQQFIDIASDIILLDLASPLPGSAALAASALSALSLSGAMAWRLLHQLIDSQDSGDAASSSAASAASSGSPVLSFANVGVKPINDAEIKRLLLVGMILTGISMTCLFLASNEYFLFMCPPGTLVGIWAPKVAFSAAKPPSSLSGLESVMLWSPDPFKFLAFAADQLEQAEVMTLQQITEIGVGCLPPPLTGTQIFFLHLKSKSINYNHEARKKFMLLGSFSIV